MQRPISLPVLAAAGFAATAISFGPARMGFGLFVPRFEEAFGLSSSTVGLVSSLGFAGFFLGLLLAQALLDRAGPMLPVLAGLSFATVGLGMVALAPGVALLAAGVFLAASSAGLSWSPFNDAVHRKLRDIDRPTALSEISTGTSVGIALTGAVALAMVLSGFDWRISWALFAAASLLALAINWTALRRVEKAPERNPRGSWRRMLTMRAAPLFAVAFIYGVTSAVYISFGADRYAAGDGVPLLPEGTEPAFVYILYGLFGLTGLATGWLRKRIGLPMLVRALMLVGAASLALAAAFPAHLAGLTSSAGLQGINVMMTSAVLALWSERLFPAFPSLGFTAALLATAAGSVVGPAAAGFMAGAIGSAPMFWAVAALPAAAAACLPRRVISDQPTPGGAHLRGQAATSPG